MSSSFALATRLVFGAGVRAQAASAVATLGRRALVVTGAASLERSGMLAELLRDLVPAGVECTRVHVDREPDTAMVAELAERARAAGCDVVLAVGGGSAMDAGKAVAAMAANPGAIDDHLEGMPHGPPRPLANDPLPVMCLPTTAGTGSEVTRNAVIQVGSLHVKRSLRDDRLFPRVALVDPELTAACPPAVAAACGFDALTHLAESFVSLNAQPTTDALARDGVPRALAGLRALAAGAATPASRADLTLAASLGGMCLANAGLGAAHGLVAPLGGRHPIAHGAGLAALLPATLLINAGAIAARAPGSLAERRLRELATLIGADGDVARAAAELTALRRRLGLRGLAAGGVGESDLAAIVAGCSGSLRTNPIALTSEELTGILREAFAD